MNVKFHSSQEVTNQSIATNVFRNTNQKAEEAQVVEDLAVEEALVAEEAQDLVEEALAEEEDLTEDHVKCTKLLVETAAKHVKFHSNQKKTDQSIVENVFRSIEVISKK